MTKPIAMIIGVGDGLPAALAREIAVDHDLTLLARSGEMMQAVAQGTGARMVLLDASDESVAATVFDDLRTPPRLAVYNPSARVRRQVTEFSSEAVCNAADVTAIGVFLAGKHAARSMLDADPTDGKRDTILFTGASAGVKGFPF